MILYTRYAAAVGRTLDFSLKNGFYKLYSKIKYKIEMYRY